MKKLLLIPLLLCAQSALAAENDEQSKSFRDTQLWKGFEQVVVGAATGLMTDKVLGVSLTNHVWAVSQCRNRLPSMRAVHAIIAARAAMTLAGASCGVRLVQSIQKS